MTTIDLTPLYRSSIGFDRLASLLDTMLSSGDITSAGYPPYDIEVLEGNKYAITITVAGFDSGELGIQVEKGVLTIHGKKAEEKGDRKYLYQSIANRSFKMKFNLADYVKVTGAELNNGLLKIRLEKEIPEAIKPKAIPIDDTSVSRHKV